MSIKVKKQGNICKITVEGEMTIYQASDLYEKFKKQLATCDSLEIDLQHITEMDTAGVQILLALKREANASGKTVSMIMHSEPVIEVFELISIVHEFGDPIVLSNRPNA